MSKLQTNQQGFGVIVVILVIAVVAAIAIVGMRVMGNQLQSSVASSTQTKAAVPATITSKADLQTASQALNTTNVDSVDLTQLDSDLNSLL